MLRVPIAVAALASLAVLPVAAPAARAGAPPPPRWAWPVPGPHPVVRPFVAPSGPYAAGHRGIDLAAAVGTAVTAPDDGVVRWAGTIVDRGVLAIEHGGGTVSSLEPVRPLVRRGDRVRRGQVVAVVATGGMHRPGVLHLGARISGDYVSPLLLLGGLRRAVLLPLTTWDARAGSSR